MFNKVSNFLGMAIGIPMIMVGFAFAVAGAAVVKCGVWLGDFTLATDDITDEELAQIIREAEEAQRLNDKDED